MVSVARTLTSPRQRPPSDSAAVPRATVLLAAVLAWWLPLALGLAVPMTQDPKGFQGIPWGAALSEHPKLVLAEPGDPIAIYDFKDGPPPLGGTAMESVKLSSIEGKFARVAMRYTGKQTHDRVLAYLEAEYGPIDRSPGAMMRGLNQQYTWRGPDTEINLVYQAHNERGVIFIESRVLAPRFNDTLSETAY